VVFRWMKAHQVDIEAMHRWIALHQLCGSFQAPCLSRFRFSAVFGSLRSCARANGMAATSTVGTNQGAAMASWPECVMLLLSSETDPSGLSSPFPEYPSLPPKAGPRRTSSQHMCCYPAW
jgi:hypothetical protein